MAKKIKTGSNQFVGNWPGVTVEKKEGRLKGYKDVKLIDFPFKADISTTLQPNFSLKFSICILSPFFSITKN